MMSHPRLLNVQIEKNQLYTKLDRLPNFYFILQVDLNKMTVTEGLGFSDEEAKEVIFKAISVTV